MVKFVVVTGGSLSGLGKGTCASSIGVCLKSQGYRVTAVKIDPYLNVDAGTISPAEHGEVFVLKDGHEGDLDLGNYERALNVCLTKDHNITTGKIYSRVIEAERKGDYLGVTVQVVPHVTDCIQEWISNVARVSVDDISGEPDICLVEVGGTVGDIESSVYLEALCQMAGKMKATDMCLAHLTYLPTIGEEQKTKPSQHSFRALRSAGLKPDFVMARCQKPLSQNNRQKLSVFSGVPVDNVVSCHDVVSSYLVPKVLIEQNLHHCILQHLDLPPVKIGYVPDSLKTPVEVWAEMAQRLFDVNATDKYPQVTIGIVGKYLGSNDTYLSIVKALEHSAGEARIGVKVLWIEAEHLTDNEEKLSDDPSIAAAQKEQWMKLKSCNAILTPGGFGHRGMDGKIVAARYARENKVPYLGICYGLHTMLIEAARHLLKLPLANTEECDPQASDLIVVYMPETVNQAMGGTMRLGDRATIIGDTNSLAFKLYDQSPVVHERHRHRYEVNTKYLPDLEKVGYNFVGRDDKRQRMEIVELRDHPFFVGVQYHPEFTSKVSRPNPLFLGLVLAAADKLDERFETYNDCLNSGASYGLPGRDYGMHKKTGMVSRGIQSDDLSKIVTTTDAGDVEKENVPLVSLH